MRARQEEELALAALHDRDLEEREAEKAGDAADENAVTRSGLWRRLSEILFLEHRRAREIEEKLRAAAKAARLKLHQLAQKAILKRRRAAARQQMKNRQADERRLQERRRVTRLQHHYQTKAAAPAASVTHRVPAAAPPALKTAFSKTASRRSTPDSSPPPIPGGPRRLRALFRTKNFAKLRR